MGTEVNSAFAVPAEVEARLRAKAEELASEQVDEAALLAKFTAEAKARKEAAIQAKADLLAEGSQLQDIDAHGFPKKYFKINVYKGGEKDALTYVTPSVNGFVWKIERGADVIVHSVVLEALDHAVAGVVVQTGNGLVITEAPRFPYQIKGEATEAEYLAYREKMRKQTEAQRAVS